MKMREFLNILAEKEQELEILGAIAISGASSDVNTANTTWSRYSCALCELDKFINSFDLVANEEK